MQAVICPAYGILEVREVDKPSVGDDDILVRVRAAGANPLDWRILQGDPYLMRLVTGLRGPHPPVLGADFSGVVDTVGKQVTRFQPGDAVFGQAKSGGMKVILAHGAFAEFILVTEDTLERKPANLTFEQASAVPVAALTALRALHGGGIRAGQNVLVNGASGGVGTFAVQIAKAMGAEVTGVCSGPNVEMVRSIGADRAIDYTREDFAVLPAEDRPYDLFVDNVGNRSMAECRRVMARDATYVAVGGGSGRWLGPMTHVFRTLAAGLFASQKMIPAPVRPVDGGLGLVKDLLETGKITPVMDRVYSGLGEVREALRYLEEGHARGKVVISVAQF